MRTKQSLGHQVLAPTSLHEASIRPTGLDSGGRSLREEEPGRRSSDAGPRQLICYTRRRRKVLSPTSASATTSTQLASCLSRHLNDWIVGYEQDNREVAEDDSEDNGDTGSNQGPVFGYFPVDVSFATIHEHRTSIDVDDKGWESPKRTRLDSGLRNSHEEEPKSRSSHEEELGRRSSDAGPGQLICYTRTRRKILSPTSAPATTSTQLADNREVAEDDSEDNGDTGSNQGPVFGYFPVDVSFATIHEHRTSIDVDKGGESPKRVGEISPSIRTKKRRRDVASSVTTSVETGTNCNKKPAPERQREPTGFGFVWETYNYPNVPYPEVMKMSWGPWSRSRKEAILEAISESAYSMKLQKKKKIPKATWQTFPSTASIPRSDSWRTPAGSRLINILSKSSM